MLPIEVAADTELTTNMDFLDGEKWRGKVPIIIHTPESSTYLPVLFLGKNREGQNQQQAAKNEKFKGFHDWPFCAKQPNALYGVVVLDGVKRNGNKSASTTTNTPDKGAAQQSALLEKQTLKGLARIDLSGKQLGSLCYCKIHAKWSWINKLDRFGLQTLVNQCLADSLPTSRDRLSSFIIH